MFLYRTYFKLTNPVNDFSAAKEYLAEDDMTVYLKQDDRIAIHIRSNIEKIEWILTNEDNGHIDLLSKIELTAEELKEVSEFVSGQNSDGLGEGFEGQNFACYENLLYEEMDLDDDDYFITSEFDWKTNEYLFSFVEEI